MSYDIVLAWAGSCSSGQILKNNFIDWFQYSSSVKGSATTCDLVPNCPIAYYPYVIDLTVTCAKDKASLIARSNFQSILIVIFEGRCF